ncbi:MAG: hypothetical protein K0R46_3287 [Herbinix sp.]|jgi:hypothetical protein|nr:hypothetical protein [Herbinix sp.]
MAVTKFITFLLFFVPEFPKSLQKTHYILDEKCHIT